MKEIRKICSWIYLVIFIIAFCTLYINNTMLYYAVDHTILSAIDILTVSVLLLTIISLILSFYEEWNIIENKEKNLLITLARLAIVIAAVLFTFVNRERTVFYLILLAVSADFQDENRLLKTGFWLGVILNAVLFILSITGGVENISGKGFGFVYGDHFACFMLCLMLYYCIINDGWLTWVEEIGMLCVVAFSIFVGGTTSSLCEMVVILGTYYRHYVHNGGVPFQDKENFGLVIPVAFQILYLPIRFIYGIITRLKPIRYRTIFLRIIRYSYIIGATLIFFLTWTYRPFEKVWNKIGVLRNFCSRLMLGSIGFEEFPVQLFGNGIQEAGYGATERAVNLYFVLDSSYIRILLKSGLIVFLVIIGLLTWTQIRLQKHERVYASFLIAVFSVDVIMEAFLSYFPYNLFVLLAFCQLSEKPGINRCKRCSFSGANTKKRTIITVGAVVSFIICLLWIYTAYQITAWRGHTPEYGATLVVPGSFLEAKDNNQLYQKRRTWAKKYLAEHEDAACIVCNEADKEWLVENNVDEDRVYVLTYNSVEEMLVESDKLIEGAGLPSRLTVCTYDIQQHRIQKYADKLEIPINSIYLKMSGANYVINFIAEQWRMLWEK